MTNPSGLLGWDIFSKFQQRGMCCEVGPVSLSTKKPLHIFPRVACLLLLVGWGASHKGGSCCMYPTGAAFPQELLKASQARVMQGERKESTCQARDLVLSSWPCLGWSSRVGISACQLCLALLLSTDVCPWGWNPPSPPLPITTPFPPQSMVSVAACHIPLEGRC